MIATDEIGYIFSHQSRNADVVMRFRVLRDYNIPCEQGTVRNLSVTRCCRHKLHIVMDKIIAVNIHIVAKLYRPFASLRFLVNAAESEVNYFAQRDPSQLALWIAGDR